MAGTSDAGPGSRGGVSLRDALSDRIQRDAEELTRRWHEELESRLRIRPQNVFPGSALLDGMPDLLRWIADTIRNGRVLGPDREESVHNLAGHWRQSGYSIEESLLHVRVLGGILHEAVRSHLDSLGGTIQPSEAAEAAERLCASLSTVETVLVGTYRDEEERRFADFGGTLVHEIRGQLNVAMTAAELLSLEADGVTEEAIERRREAVKRITRAIRGAGEMVTSVRNFSRVRAGQSEWTMRPFDEVVNEVMGSLRREATKGVNVELETDVPSVLVPGEAVLLALHNLVENAIAYSDPDKDRRWVRVHVIRDDAAGRWTVQIGDNGIGIPEAEQERIFARFLRGRRAEGNGFGLGLSIARQAALSIGGTIMLESREGVGSTFSFTIPMSETGAVEAEA